MTFEFSLMTICVIFACLLIICLAYIIKLKSSLKIKLERYNELVIERVKLIERLKALSLIEEKYNALQQDFDNMRMKASTLELSLKAEKESVHEKLMLIEKAESILSDKFSALSADALAKNNQSFLDLAKASFENMQITAQSQMENKAKEISGITEPIRKTLGDVEEKLQILENNRISMTQAISEQINSLIMSQDKLKLETYKLSSALKIPNVRGRWGEMQLRRVVEIAGMINHCDFDEQVTESTVRPDMVIHLPGQRSIIVDAKAPLGSYMSALESDNEEDRIKLLKNHAKQVRNHCMLLSSKHYPDKFENASDFVVMFLPGEVFFSTALEQDPLLIEFAIEHKIIISTPTTLLALLHSVAAGWRNEALSENAKNIVRMGKELHQALKAVEESATKLGSNISKTVDSYNEFSTRMNMKILTVADELSKLEDGYATENKHPIKPIIKKVSYCTAQTPLD